MKNARKVFATILTLIISSACANGQDAGELLMQKAVRIDFASGLNDSVYQQLSPFQIIMIGEVHGTNEPAQLVKSLAALFASKGDSVQVGLEIPSGKMSKYLASHSDSSIYMSDFFASQPIDGRESLAWAQIISGLKNNRKIHLFFFDTNSLQPRSNATRDSLMYLNIKHQYSMHPGWKVITLSGNIHNMLTPEAQLGRNTMASYLLQGKELCFANKICAINHYYSLGTCLANHGDGLKIHRIGNPESGYSKAFGAGTHLLLVKASPSYPYNGVFYTQNVTAAEMVHGNLDIPTLKGQLALLYNRDQKTRKGTDSAEFMSYIDSTNLAQIAPLIDKFGWPGMSFVGAKGNRAAFAVIQHADSATQEKYFPLLQQSVADSESMACDMALQHDRLLMRRGKKQIYGSQVVFNKEGGAEFWPIEDEANANERRAAVGLGKIEEYAKYFGIDYKPTKDW